MAIATDSYQNIQYSGSTVSQIGLSKTLDNYTWDEIFDYQYCSMCSALSRIAAPYAANTNIEDYDVTKLGFTVEVTDSWDGDADFKAEQTGVIQYPQGLYCKIIWLRGTRSESATYQIYNNNMANFKLVTEWDAPNFVFTIPNPQSTFGACATSWSDDESTVKTTWHTDREYGELKYRYRHDGTYNDISISGNVMPYMLYKHNGHYYCQQLRQTPRFFGATIDKSGSDAKVGINNLIYPVEDGTANSLSFFGGNVAADGFYYETDRIGTPYNPWEGNYKLTTKRYAYCNLDNDDCMGRLAYAGTGPSQYCGLDTYFKTKHASLLFWAGCGVKFYADKLYKPIIEDGFVTDFSDDMDADSDLDRWSGDSNHTVPDAPPTPTPTPSGGEDDIDSMGFDGMSCNVGGPAKYYIMSYSDIHHLIGDFNVHAEPGTTISNNIISCYVNALDWNWSTGSEVIEIYSGGAQTIAFTSDMNYKVLTGYNARDIIGSIDVPRMTNTFYDFSPYSTYEVYVPFCGWVALPDTVAGRNIKIYFETDEATCGCKGRVFFVDSNGNGVTVAEITGSFGAPCPIQILEGGLYKQAMLSNGLQVIGGIASGVMGGASGSGVLAVSGLSNAMQGLGNCLVAGNTNYGQTIGRAGDASGLMCAGKPYLKITYPPIDEVVNNNMFAHTVGYLCNTIGQLSNFHGFTVCANPHVHISATSSEKEEIKRLLEEGVILP